jgi:prepilin-type processing-associated H-X9-DG protein
MEVSAMRSSRWQFLLPLLVVSGLATGPATGGDDPAPITRRDITASQNNLKQIGLAIHGFADTNGGRMPANIKDKDGKALLSWRVAILPYIEEDILYRQFKLDQPWDSEHNKKLIAKMPKVYAPIRVKAREGETFYQTFFGETALFGPKAAPRFPASIPDGTSNTGMVFEAGEPVIWSRPADIPFDEKKPLARLGGLFDGECNVVMCDGSVKRLKKSADEKEMKKLIIPFDGNVIDFSKLER